MKQKETDMHILMRLRQEEETIRLNRDLAYARYERYNRELRDKTRQINNHLDNVAAKQ